MARTRELAPDLLILDINMPGMTGFDVVKALQSDDMPNVIFCTAYQRYALDAFDLHAVDYLLKPVDERRVQRGLERARQRLGEVADEGERKTALLGAIDDIARWVDAAGDYMCVHVKGETHILRSTLKNLMERLDSDQFKRIHRSTVVNLERIKRVTPLKKGEYMLDLGNDEQLKVSRNYRDAIRGFLDKNQA